MKNARRVCLWIALSLVLQLGGFFYLDKFFFTTETNFKAKKVEDNKTTVAKDAKIQMPQDAEHFGVSFNGRYAAYYEGNELKVVDTQTSEVKKIPFESGAKISLYKWLPDRERMIIAEKKTGKQGEVLKFSSYDVKRGEKTEIRDNHDSAILINLPDKKSEVEDIALSTLTNVIYVKVAHGGYRNSIYRINIMGQMEKVKTNAFVVGNIITMNREDYFIYEDLTAKEPAIRTTKSSNPIKIKDASKLALLSIDDEDRIYIGDMDGDKVKRIFYGHINDSTDKWSILNLSTTMDKKDIYVSKAGKIYLNNNLSGIVTEAGVGKQTVYSGKFYEMYHNGVATIDNGILVKKSFE